MIQRHKTTIFMNAKETIKVKELKIQLARLTKQAPEDMRFYNMAKVLETDFIL